MSSRVTRFSCRRYGMLSRPMPGHFPCPETTQGDGAACYCSVTDLIQEQQPPTPPPSETEVAYFDARASVDEHFAVGEPTPSGDEPRRDIQELPFTPITAIRGHTDAADDSLSPPWAPRRRRLNAVLPEPTSPLTPWDLDSPTNPRSRAPRGTAGPTEHIRFASQTTPTRPVGSGSGWQPCREWDRAGAAMATWASQQHQSLPRFSPPPRPLSPGEGPSGLGRRCTAVRRREEAARGPDYPDHAPFIGSAGAQDNGPYPAPPPRPQQGPQRSYHPRPSRHSRFVRPPMTRWPTPQPSRPRPRLNLELTYCPAQHAPGAVASSRTYYPEHTGPATLHSSSTNSCTQHNGGTFSGVGGGNNGSNTDAGAGANRHLNASSVSPPSSSPKEQASESPGSSPPRHIFQAELDFVQPDEAVFSMAAATHPAPPASESERRPNFFQRLRNVLRASWRWQRSRGEQTSAVEKDAEGYEAGDEDSLEEVPLVANYEDGNGGDETEAWSELSQPADSDSGEIVAGDEGEAGSPVVKEAVRSKERFSID